ncbi:MAG: 1-deoxy-D-xylulose-5-phosphate reductoisomerase [Spirochaetales bacterium]|nr:1-deoxy-D-xylulose-5-phosphate reductoisomerase [Spirochaetales bacterium]
MKIKRIIVAGSTGSIGSSTVDVVRKNPDLFKIAGLSCNTNWQKMFVQADEFLPEAVAVSVGFENDGVNSHKFLKQESRNYTFKDNIKIYVGTNALVDMVRETKADLVVNGVSGASGLLVSFWTLMSGKDLALANKESIVMAGELLLDMAKKKEREILPIDSEHSAVFNLMRILDRSSIDEIVLTASGGALRDYTTEQLNNVTVADALRHPTWKMGKKITIDSASMANKGLEVIEANKLFSFSPEKLKVVIHPQSIVHSLIRTKDGMLYGQIGKPDMRLPIQNALTYPEIRDTGFSRLFLDDVTLEFRKIDFQKYRMLSLAYSVIEEGGVLPIVYNAANEVAVSMFIDEKIKFVDIPDVVEQSLSKNWQGKALSIEDIMDVDLRARKISKDYIR